MKILAVDTSSKFLCLALCDEASVYEYNIEVGSKLSCLLHVSIQRTLDALNWRIRDIDYFACGTGPGSFTGMRVGLVAMKGLSYSLGKPLMGISSLDILAKNVTEKEAAVVPIIDAKRNLIYCSIYRIKNCNLKRTSAYMLLNEKEFFSKIKDNAIILGDGLNIYRDKILKLIKGVTTLSRDYWYPKGYNLISLARERIKAKKFDSPYKLVPTYLYPKECQIKI